MGWLELGNHVEAGEELSRVTPVNLVHPDVLELRWAVCAEGQSWNAAAEVAESLVGVAPERASGWVQHAYSVRRMRGGGLEQAEKLLLSAFNKFPKDSVIPYNLACYAAQQGRLDEARDWFWKAVDRDGGLPEMRERALADKDLEPLWTWIGGLKERGSRA
ncbi:MAG: hypothetical protein QOF48_1893 [Verrucomicrobiota bacterium]|jgi:Flp pilus assembly protein TadD